MTEREQVMNMSDLDRLFYWRGISDSYHSFRGEHVVVPLENRLKLINAMGFETTDEKAIRKEAFELDVKPWLDWIPPLFVAWQSDPFIDISLSPEDLEANIVVVLSKCGEEVVRTSFEPNTLEEVGDYHHDGERYSRRRLRLQVLQPDYYDVTLSSKANTASGVLVLSPNSSYRGADKKTQSGKEPGKMWGLILQLYTLRSKNNWGIGDFKDLQTLIKKSAPLGVDVLGLNPFHALQSDLEYDYSPYSPSDRRFLNPLYIDVQDAPCYREEFSQAQEVSELRALTHVNYKRVKNLKYAVLYRSFEAYVAQAECSDLARYIKEASDALPRFAAYEATYCHWDDKHGVIQDAHGNEDVLTSLKASELIHDLQKNTSKMSEQIKLILFHCYLQWLAEDQLSSCQKLARDLGMKVGIIRDLAVGASGGGAEVMTNPDLYCARAAIGAPPDPLALTGQNWGIPPVCPTEMRRSAFTHFRALLRANMKHCGALRIDHAMSLYRLWWVPPEETADHGAYVYYPFPELMGVLCLESYLNQTLVVAEDLGVVPDEFRHEMSERDLLGNRILYFEKHNDTEFKKPHEIEENVLSMLNNHDVPTLVGWWNESDLELRQRLDMMEDGTTLDDVISHRRVEKQNLLYSLDQENRLPADWSTDSVEKPIDLALVSALLCYFAKCRSHIFVVQLEDLLMMSEPVNVPGTYREHKNWSRKLTHSLDDIFGDPDIIETLEDIDRTRKQL